MKPLTSITLIFTAVLFTLQAGAQKRITEGTISYDIVVNTGDNKPTLAAMFDGATSIVYLKGYMSRSEMISSLGTQATLVNGKDGTVSVLKEYGAQKYLIKMTAKEWKDANKKYEGITYTYIDQYKEIAGYKCQKAVGKFNDGTTFTVFFTKDLIADNRDFEYAYKALPGLAMEYETIVGNLTVTYTVAKISFNPVPAAKFELPKAGYREMTYEESKNARGN